MRSGSVHRVQNEKIYFIQGVSEGEWNEKAVARGEIADVRTFGDIEYRISDVPGESRKDGITACIAFDICRIPESEMAIERDENSRVDFLFATTGRDRRT